MRKLIAVTALGVYLVLAFSFVGCNKPLEPEKKVNGFYVQQGENSPYAALYEHNGNAVLGFSQNQKGEPHSFAIVADKDSTYFQVRGADGQIEFIPTTELIQLRRPLRPAAQPAPAPVEGPVLDKVRERLLIRIVRNKVEAELAKDGFRLAGGMFPDAKPLSKERIKELMAQLDDETIIRSVKEASPKTWAATAEPGGFLMKLIEWIAAHQEEIMAVVALIIKILALF